MLKMTELSGQVYPVILSGGVGSRLWPLSTSEFPKQFHSFGGPQSLFQQAVTRLWGAPFEAPIIVCGQGHQALVSTQLDEIGARSSAVLMEPVGRSTAASCCVAALRLRDSAPDAVIVACPSDHLIQDVQAFRNAVAVAVEAAQKSSLVLLGVTPTGPVEDYGYVTVANAPTGLDAVLVEKFVEKPKAERAQMLIDDGRSFWNSGIYVFTPKLILEELQKWSPEVVAACVSALEKGETHERFTLLDADAFSASPNLSIDHAVSEKTDRASVVPLAAEWSDLGNWRELWAALSKDNSQNAGLGNIEFGSSTNSLAFSHTGGPNIHLESQDGTLVVAGKDDVYVSSLSHHASISAAITHRPWGSFRIIGDGDGFQVKEIVVNEGGILSLQRHKHRSERWTILEGRARVTRDTVVDDLEPDQTVDIPVGCVHRLENVGVGVLRLVELQLGTVICETDIERLEDRYGRA